ncbi:hypothetical protein [Hydrogenophaga sp. BPS33]|uniref:hypothetical protein n=1 Tax=Hydrogenophaga sp. BPS33 TaxID=2651974 RepID=UPI00131FE2BB|nr:hypothetical protein [Hydrogenophaga sp. BPS33]QHE84422.1 hypothetical protein F9K07_05730 [Hydrogenophaga sp. BPS33]
MSSSPLGPATSPPKPLAQPTQGDSSLKPQASGTGAAERSQAAPRPLDGLARARFESIRPMSQMTEAVTATQDEEEEGEAQFTSDRIEAHRIDLLAALTRPIGPHAAQAETSLRALVAENQDHDTIGPAKLHLYLGFGEVDSADLQKTSALAKQLRAAAGEIWGQLDRECKQMLDWITQEWKAYEWSDVPVGLRLAKSRQATEGPRTREILEWSAHASEADDLWSNPTTVLRREAQRNELVFALIARDASTISQLLQDIPSDITHLNRYFPPAGQAIEVRVCEMLHKAAHQYNREHPGNARLVRYTLDALDRAKAADRVQTDLSAFNDAELDQVYAPQVRELCLALRDTATEDLRSQGPRFQALMQEALNAEDLDDELAAQPFANLKTVQIQCNVLEKVVDKKVLAAFRASLSTAITVQSRVSRRLQQELLKKHSNIQDVEVLAMMEYAKRMTSLPVDFVSAGATWGQVERMRDRMQTVYESLLESEDTTVEKHALYAVFQQIVQTARLPH